KQGFERQQIGDLNGDGSPDIAVVNNYDTAKPAGKTGEVVWFENKPGTAWGDPQSISSLNYPYDLRLAVLQPKGDPNKPDIVVGCFSGRGGRGEGLWWLENQGLGKWKAHEIDNAPEAVQTVAVAAFKRGPSCAARTAAASAPNLPSRPWKPVPCSTARRSSTLRARS